MSHLLEVELHKQGARGLGFSVSSFEVSEVGLGISERAQKSFHEGLEERLCSRAGLRKRLQKN